MGRTRDLIRRSLLAGLFTGALTAAAVLVVGYWFDVFHLMWPFAFVPVFATGVAALSRSGSAIRSPRDAALAGALAGIGASLVSTAAIAFVTVQASGASPLFGTSPNPLANLNAVLQERPFSLTRAVLFYDLPFRMPDWWPFLRGAAGAGPVSQAPWPLTLFVPIGVALSATQAWAAYLVGRKGSLSERLVSIVARVRATFGSKMRMGFLLFTSLVFVVGWLGFTSTEEMHTRLHRATTLEHWREHVATVNSALSSQAMALSRLGDSPSEAALQQVMAFGQMASNQITHLKTLPPPRHAVPSVGEANLIAVAESSLPLVTEADVAVRDLSAGLARVLGLYRSGKAVEAQAALVDLTRTRGAVTRPLAELDAKLEDQLADWVTNTEGETHLQLIILLALVLVATGLAFPLGYVFSQVVVRPVSAVDRGLERISRGDFAQRVEVPNRDELGELASHVNETGQRLEGLYGELRGLNEGLQQKVQDAVREIERSRLLRRYLPHQVADQVIASGDESLLQTHRREITVVFGDLRGFTAFSETAEPEVVMGVLREYHGAVGELISRYSGTLEHFAGDGWMVYFNDPVPVADHAAQAVRMAVAMRDRVGELARTWRKHGFELDFGVGIAIGYATLGTIGFEGRHDYGAVGAVTNLSARLSAEARGGEILVTQRVQALVDDRVEAERVADVTLKGFVKPVVAYNIVRLREAVVAAT